MQKAVEAGQYHIAEQARIEAYAFFELGPEQRLRGLAPSSSPAAKASSGTAPATTTGSRR